MAKAGDLLLDALGAAAGVALLVAASTPAWQMRTAIPAGIVLVVASAVWLVRWSFWVASRRTGTATTSRRLVALFPVGVVVVVSLLFAAVPLRVRFAASEGAFRKALRQTDDGRPRQLGLYRVPTRFGTMFFVESDPWSYDGGFLFTGGKDPEFFTGSATIENARFRHLSGDWYAFSVRPRAGHRPSDPAR